MRLFIIPPILFLLASQLCGQVLLVSPQPTLAPKDCKCVECKCDPCDCHAKPKPLVSDKKTYSPQEASVIVRATKGKESYQASGTAICDHTVLTCWHLLREGGTLTVNGKPATLIRADKNSDVALIRTEQQLKPVKVAAVAPKASESVTAYGFEHDKRGKLWRFPSRVTRLNRYSGFSNQSILGRPKSGRSGGGLFNERGELVGVCSAADGGEGLYAGLAAVQAILNPVVKQSLITEPPTMFLKNPACPDGQCPLVKKPSQPAPPLTVAPRQQAITGPVFKPASPARQRFFIRRR
jgi:hypothetical protein